MATHTPSYPTTSATAATPTAVMIVDPPRGFRQTMSNALIITRREVRDSFRDWRILAPIFVLTFLFPSLAQYLAGAFSDFVTGYGAQIIGDRTIPFLLMVVGFFPISISLVIALETFVGEKERRSLEPLLSTPLTNTELYIGKTLAAMIPPLVSSYGGMLVYLSGLLGGDLQWRPQPMLIFQIIALTTVQALVMVTGAVVVSSQTTSTRAANLLASFIIIPMALVIQGESVIMFLAPDTDSPYGIGALWAIIVGMFFVVILLLRLGNSIFNREELLGRTLDQLNLRGIARKIWMHIRAVDDQGTPARNLVEWYRRGVGMSLGRTRTAIWITAGVFVLFLIGGYLFGTLPEWRLPIENNTFQAGQVGAALNSFITPQTQTVAFMFIVWQNARVLLAALILGIFSFGVGALILTPAVYVILGYVAAQIVLSGNSIMIILASLFPHGLVEIPMIILATAAAFKLGAVVTRPPAGMTVGQGWMLTLGDTLKIGLGLVIPGLILAALLEAYLTPLFVVQMLGGV